MSEPSGLEPSLSGTDFRLAIARWRLGILDLREAEALALEALIAGYDGPGLRELVGEHASWREIEGVFERVVQELGDEVPSPIEATETVIRAIASDVFSGREHFIEGVQDIVETYEALFLYELDGPLERFEPMRERLGLRELPRLLAEWGYTPNERASIEREMREILHGLSGAPVTPDSELSPTLGGSRGTPEAEQTPPEDRWRFEFHFNFDVSLRRFFRWNRR